MTSNHIHIVSFDIPYPPDYGGVIDVFYTIQALHEAGIAITLHCSYKGTLTHFPQLEQLCDKVYYYKRRTNIIAQLSRLPYEIVSRIDKDLLTNLLQDEDPILFEGLISCGYMSHPLLAQRKKIFRESNIEHDYYRGLAEASRSLWKSLFYRIEAWKLERYEPIIRHAASIAAVAHQDEHYFQQRYPEIPTYYIPSFHGSKEVQVKDGIGDYILYHGNLRVPENENAALFLLQHVVPALPECRFIFAGRNPSPKLRAHVAKYQQATLIESPDAAHMERLISDAQIHLLPTFQGTGLKLKLLNVLYNGRFVIVNSPMVNGTDVAPLCHIANTAEEMIDACRQLVRTPFSQTQIQKRLAVLESIYNDKANIQKLTHLL